MNFSMEIRQDSSRNKLLMIVLLNDLQLIKKEFHVQKVDKDTFYTDECTPIQIYELEKFIDDLHNNRSTKIVFNIWNGIESITYTNNKLSFLNTHYDSYLEVDVPFSDQKTRLNFINGFEKFLSCIVDTKI